MCFFDKSLYWVFYQPLFTKAIIRDGIYVCITLFPFYYILTTLCFTLFSITTSLNSFQFLSYQATY